MYANKNNSHGINKNIIKDMSDFVAYLKDVSEIINNKKLKIKIFFLFLKYLILFLGIMIKKQQVIAITGRNKGL